MFELMLQGHNGATVKIKVLANFEKAKFIEFIEFIEAKNIETFVTL